MGGDRGRTDGGDRWGGQVSGTGGQGGRTFGGTVGWDSVYCHVSPHIKPHLNVHFRFINTAVIHR